MFLVNGNPILANELEVLTELRAQLASSGVELLRHLRPGPSNIQFTCPIHAHGQEHRPSCGITTVSTDKTPAGTVHCFTCGYTATLEELVSNCFGKDDKGSHGRAWLTKNFLTVSVEDRGSINLDMGRRSAKAQRVYVSEEELDSYRFYHSYMQKRKLTNDVIEMFDVGYDSNFKLKDEKGIVKRELECVTFPVRDETGGTLFLARRSITDKFFHYPEGVDKPVYGLWELEQYASDTLEVIVCESIFNAITCWVYGKPAIALLGLGTKQQYAQLAKLTCRKLIIALDPDEAGLAATEKLFKALAGKKILSRYVLPDGKDVNDLSEEEFNSLEEFF